MNHNLTSINRQAFLFLLLSVFVLTLSRTINLFVFGDWQDISNFTSKLDDLFFMGLRFDLKVSASFLLIFVYLPALFLVWFNCCNRLSRWTGFILTTSLVILITLSFVEFGYLLFFGTPIDMLIFGIFEDDTSAVISSITGDWRLLSVFFVSLITLAATAYLYPKLNANIRQNRSFHTKNKSLLLVIVFILVLSGFTRGTFDTFPLSRKNSSISHSSFVNSLVMNSPLNLFYASKDRRRYNIFSLSNADILRQANVKSIESLKRKAGYNKDNPLVRTTALNNELAHNSPHIVFVQMEGWSTHIALQHANDNQVLGEFSQHAESDYFYPRFFSNAYGTNPTIERLLLNSPITPVSQSSARNSSFTLSNILPFKKNNYQTSFLSGGFGAWRNHDKFWTLQGFDKYIGRSTMEEHFGVVSDNPWGIYDEYLFEYLKEELLAAEASNNPLFSFVLTTNNHPPVRLPENYKAPPLNLERYGISKDDDHKFSILTGYHYQSNKFGEFLSWLKQNDLKDKVIVVATGDHVLKGFTDYSPTKLQFMRYAVPTYFYVPEKLDKLKRIPKSIIGSHNDLFPTIFELALSNTEYYAFGQPIMEKQASTSVGWIDQGAFLFNNGLVNKSTNSFFPWNGEQNYLLDDEPQKINNYQQKIIEQHRYKSWLQQWLLLEDHKNSLAKIGSEHESTN